MNEKNCTNCYDHANECESTCHRQVGYPNWRPIYEDMVRGLAKPGADIIATLTSETMHNMHMAIGVAGEAGELLDAIKKQAIYNKPVDRENVIEELGDLEFYMEGLRQGLNITREETLVANIGKLGKRYGQKYSDAAAQARVDKQ